MRRLLKATVFNENWREAAGAISAGILLLFVFVALVITEGWISLLYVAAFLVCILLAVWILIVGGGKISSALRKWTFKE